MRNKYTDEKKKRNSVERQKHIGEKQRMFKCKKETCLSFFQYIFFFFAIFSKLNRSEGN